MTGEVVADRVALYDRLPPLEGDRWWAEQAARSPDGCVLELGAGTGRLTAALVATGAQVIAVERDPVMAARLHARLPDVEVVVADAADVGRGPGVGLVLLPTSLLNEQADAAARRAVLTAARERLRPDGRVVAQVLGPWWLVALPARSVGSLRPSDGGPPVQVTIEAGSMSAWPARRRAQLHYRFADGWTGSDHLDAAVLTPGDLEADLAAAGLRRQRVHGAVPPDPPRVEDPSWHLEAVLATT